ncbi:MAG: hypothetical protein JOY54_01825 [Acidobacteriaceae bacterium]|nr:hypothetical protein [Acidobacteriaceae bacterium]
MNRLAAALSLALVASPIALAQLPDYLDVEAVRVKPEKRADFDGLVRKAVEMNRKGKGDNWIAMENQFGEGNTVFFVSQRANYAAIEEGNKAFNSAMVEGLGMAAWKKMGQDFDATIISSRTELRHRRWDLSYNAPKDPDSYTKMVGAARWIRLQQVHVNPGHQTQFEEQVKVLKATIEKNSPSWTVLVAQLSAGGSGPLYYFTTLQPSLAGFDSAPDLHKLMGDEGYAAWEKANAEVVASSETRIMRILPELSNPPEAVVNQAASFWRPKSTP